MKDFLVTGCSRSGTKYIATLLSRAGHHCRHERVFNISRLSNHEGPLETLRFWDEDVGESSFLAVPYLDRLPDGMKVFHQVRHPVEVIRSHLGLRFFAPVYQPSEDLAFNHPEILRVIDICCPEVLHDADELLRCMRFWTYWNRAIEEKAELEQLSYFRYRVEDMGLPLLREIVDRIGGTDDRTVLESALADVSTSTNSKPRDESVGWDELPEGAEKDELRALARRYGYLPA
jgi:hypothetical protein